MSCDGVAEKIGKASVVLLDVAGTVTSICFVKDTLYPYFSKQIENYLNNKWDVPEVKKVIESLKEECTEIPKDAEKDAVVKSLVASFKTLDEKKETEAIKTLQGLVYKDGYESGELKGHIYPDVATQLPLWASGKRVCVYSSGSIDAQKLLFKHSTEGDLSAHIQEYFDLAIGIKTQASSYQKIIDKLECKAGDILFLTDSVAEAKAAEEAGIASVLVTREGNAAISADDKDKFPVINSFIPIETSSKRKIDEVTEEPEAPPAKLAKKLPESTETVKNEETVAKKPVEDQEKMEVDADIVPEVKEAEKKDEIEKVTSTSETTVQESLETPAPTTTTTQMETENEAETKEAAGKETEKSVTAAEPESTSITTTEPVAADGKSAEKATNNKTDTKTVEESAPSTTEKKVTATDAAKTEQTETKETENESPAEEVKTTASAEPKTDITTTEETKVDSSMKDEGEKLTAETKIVAETTNKADTKVGDKTETDNTDAKTDPIAKAATETKTEEKQVVPKETTTSDKKEAVKETKVDLKESTVEKETPKTETAKVETEKSQPTKEDEKKVENTPVSTTDDTKAVDVVVAADKETKAEEKDAKKTDESSTTKEDKKTEITPSTPSTTDGKENGETVIDSSTSSGENGDAKETSEKNGDVTTTEEKENNKDLANGTAHIENGDETKNTADEAAEIKVKKIEENCSTEGENKSVEVKA